MKILLIDDDLDIRKFYLNLLINHGHEVIEANDGEEGWQKATTEKYDLILLDLMMPRLDGLGFLARREKDQNVKNHQVVVMTNLSSHDFLKECSKFGIKYYILKSEINPPDILKVVDAAYSGKDIDNFSHK